MDIVHAYQAVGSYRGAAELCGTTHKTVKRVVQRQAAGQVGRRPAAPTKTEGGARLITERVRLTDGRISAKRLLPVAEAAGYVGSRRTFERAVRKAKEAGKVKRREDRPGGPTP